MSGKSAAQIVGVNNKNGTMINKLDHNEIFFLIFSSFQAEIVFLNTIPLKNEEGSKGIFNPPGTYRMGIFWKNHFINPLEVRGQVVRLFFC